MCLLIDVQRIQLLTPTCSQARPGYYDSTASLACPARSSSARPLAPTAALPQRTTMEPERPAAVLVERLPERAWSPTKLQPEIVCNGSVGSQRKRPTSVRHPRRRMESWRGCSTQRAELCSSQL